MRNSIILLLAAMPFIMQAQPPVPKDGGLYNAVVNASGDLQIAATSNSGKDDFNFFYGTWKVTGKKLKKRLQQSDDWTFFTATLKCSPVMQGIGNIEPFYTKNDSVAFEALTLRFFDSKTKLWSIYYAWPGDVSLQNPQVGSFQGNIGWFYARDTWAGKPIIIVYRWDRGNPEKPTMCQAFSADEGKTWEWNYLQIFERIKE